MKSLPTRLTGLTLAGRWGRPPRRAEPLAGARPVRLTADDGIGLSGLHLAGPAGRTFVVSHGFTHSTIERSTRAVIDRLSTHGSVVAVDFRGHGGSQGRSSVGRDEPLDLDAAIRFARDHSDDRIISIGFSMGGAVAIRQAGLASGPAPNVDDAGVDTTADATAADRPGGAANTAEMARTDRVSGADLMPDAVVAVSPATRWYIRDSREMRRLHWMLEHPLGPLAGRWLGVRLGSTWAEVPPGPLETIGAITAPLLLIQGTADRYFSPRHAVELQRASHGHAELWIEPGMAHAESGTGPDLLDRIARWVG